MSETANNQSLTDLVSPTTKREDFAKRVGEILEPDEVINLDPNREEATNKLVEALSYMGAFAPSPATFDKDAFKFTAGFDLDDEAVNTAWDFLLRTGIFVDESKTSPGRVSIEQKTVDMLRDTKNGFLTED